MEMEDVEGGAKTRILSFDVGLKNLAYAVLVIPEGGPEGWPRLERWGILDIATETVAKMKSPRGTKPVPAMSKNEAQTTALVEILDREFYDPFEDVRYDHVLIENQPSRKNPTMKSVQVAIHTYFATLRLYMGAVGQVHLISASQKLASASGASGASGASSKEDVKSAGASYRARKAQSVELCRRCLREDLKDEVALAQLDAARKKDDLCDAFLQAMAFLKKGAPPPLNPPVKG